jgi:predicted RNase H-like HicB family nuclease
MEYIAYLHKDNKSDFGVSFPDFPGCVTAGKSLEEARRRAPEALAFHIAGMREDGEKIPKPSKMDDLADDPNRENAVAFLVTTDFSKTKTVRVNVTARENQIAMIDRLARRAGMTRSAYMVQSATSGAAFQKREGSGRRRINAHAKRVKSAKSKQR